MNETLLKLSQNYDSHFDQMWEEMKTFLSFPTISTDPSHKPDMEKCVQWLTNYLQELGFDVQVWQTPNHPIIFASHCKAGPNKPTILIYNHYDVQPVDPIELWDTPPFTATIKEGTVFARGAQDNKGQCMYVLRALKELKALNGSLPVNIKLCMEGEEEIGSKSLCEMVAEKKQELASDHLIVPDFSLQAPGVPTISVGLRGVLTMTLTLTGACRDAHSGELGGILYNPARALCEMIAKCYLPNGKVAIPGFYDNIDVLSEKDHHSIDFSFDDQEFFKIFGTTPTGGEKEFTPLERAWLRPTLEINGLSGGYAGEGFKTVIPSKAVAKISCRLVPKQDPAHVFQIVSQFFKANTPDGLSLHIENPEHGGKGLRIPFDSPIVKALMKAFEEVFQAPCKKILVGGSVNVVTELSAVCNGSSVLTGVGLATDAIHSPNENFGLDRLKQGFLVICQCLLSLGL